MVSGRNRALLIVVYFYIAWKILTLCAVLSVAALAFTIALDPTGAFLIPLAGSWGSSGGTRFGRSSPRSRCPTTRVGPSVPLRHEIRPRQGPVTLDQARPSGGRGV